MASHCLALLGIEATWQLSGSLKLSVPLELQASMRDVEEIENIVERYYLL